METIKMDSLNGLGGGGGGGGGCEQPLTEQQ